jgi:hypothetical protein
VEFEEEKEDEERKQEAAERKAAGAASQGIPGRGLSQETDGEDDLPDESSAKRRSSKANKRKRETDVNKLHHHVCCRAEAIFMARFNLSVMEDTVAPGSKAHDNTEVKTQEVAKSRGQRCGKHRVGDTEGP